MRVGEGLRPAGGSCGEVSRSTCRWTLARTCALWALTLAFAPEKKLPPSSLLSATFPESLMTFAQVGQGRLGSSENKESLYLEGLLCLVKCPRLWVPRGECYREAGGGRGDLYFCGVFVGFLGRL